MVKIKICGIKNVEDAVAACGYGADYLGFIFVEGTPRFMGVEGTLSVARKIPVGARRNVRLVGVFKDMEPGEVAESAIAAGLDAVQLQGVETPGDCAFIKERAEVLISKAFKVDGRGRITGPGVPVDYDTCDYFVFDTFHPEMSGGTGDAFDWEMFAEVPGIDTKPFFVAGGLVPGNVARAVRALKPYGVDVSSGIETFIGKKDIKLLEEFIKNAKTA